MKRLSWLFLAVPLLLLACADSAEPGPAYEPRSKTADYDMVAPAAPEMSRQETAKAMARAAAAPGGGLVSDQDDRNSSGENASLEDNAREKAATYGRLVHYNGFARIRATGVRETLDHVTELAKEVEGYVETLSSASITIRVPVASFQEVFARVLALGDVLQKSISAEDVTEAFQSVDLRLQTAKATRERLIALLAQARTEQEKLKLLREIQRVTEEIDRLETSLKTLASLAAYSRITVQVEPRQAGTTRSADDDIAEFRWIQRLSPFRRDVSQEGRLLDLEVPEGMVALDRKSHFVAESADGAVYWSSIRHNVPAGDTTYWMDAIKTRLEGDFASAEVSKVGNFQVIRFVDHGKSPYRYDVGVNAVGEDLDVVEVYYPSEAHESRYGKAVNASMERGAL